MYAIFITFDQAHYEGVIRVLDRCNCRGFTSWPEAHGRGSKTGEPHYGSHAWPSLGQAIMTMVEDHRVDPVLEALHNLDLEKPLLGLRAFAWQITKSI